MSPIAAIAVKIAGAGAAAALLSAGIAGGLAQAASPSSTPSPAASAKQTATDPRTDRRAIRRAVFGAEADVLGVTPKALLADLRKGQKVSDLAKDKGITKAQFADKLVASVRPRFETLVEHKVITQAQADKVIDRISKGYIPWWDGLHK